MSDTRVNRRLHRFYAELTSVDAILRALARDKQEEETVTAADLYTRSLDCQNLGGFALLERHAALVVEYQALGERQRVLDIGCGLGGPGRYLADRFGCAVTGMDVLPTRVQAAATLTQMVGLGDRIAYCQGDATRLPFPTHQFAQAWLLDVSIHIANKAALFGELARVVQVDGLLILHDQMGPLPPAIYRPGTAPVGAVCGGGRVPRPDLARHDGPGAPVHAGAPRGAAAGYGARHPCGPPPAPLGDDHGLH